MAMEIETALVRALAPSDLADAVVGDLHERREALARTHGARSARAAYRSDVMRSLPALVACNALRSLADRWLPALAAATVICAVCVATIPLWGKIGMDGAGYHVLRLAIIGLVLGCIPRASTLSCVFLLVLIALADVALGARNTVALVGQDGAIVTCALVLLRLVRSVATAPSRS